MSTLPEFVMRAELLQLLGISPSRLVQLQKEPDWPEAVQELVAGKLYRTADIQRWAAKRGRVLHSLDAGHQPGRRHAKREP